MAGFFGLIASRRAHPTARLCAVHRHAGQMTGTKAVMDRLCEPVAAVGGEPVIEQACAGRCEAAVARCQQLHRPAMIDHVIVPDCAAE